MHPYFKPAPARLSLSSEEKEEEEAEKTIEHGRPCSSPPFQLWTEREPPGAVHKQE
jgi:hypothetical protein